MTARLPDSIIASPTASGNAATPTAIVGDVMHRRSRPVVNEFTYPAFCLRLPLSRLGDLVASGIGHNRPALVAVHERDHGARDGSSVRDWVHALLRSEQIAIDGEIVLYAFPRMLGYLFNPVSFYVCHEAAGGVRAVLVEVNNTFGETHRYLLAHPDGRVLRTGETLTAAKNFHVSPFCAVSGHYTFRFHFGPGRWLARIDYFDTEGEPALLETHISGRQEPLLRHAARSLLWRYRWFTLGVIARIHWQAARLWLKHVPFFAKPAPPTSALTRNP